MSIEQPEIDGEPLEVAGTSASTNEASKPRSVDPVPRVDGSDASVRLPPEPPPLSVVLLRNPFGRPSGIVYRRIGPRSQREGWCQPGAGLDVRPLTWAQLNDLGKVTLLVEHTPAFERGIRADELRGAARDMLDRHYELSRVTVATFADWLRQRAGIVAGQPTEGAAGEVRRG